MRHANAILALLLTAACSSPNSPPEEFIIRVSDVQAPLVVAPGDSVHIRFVGPIGPDGCWALDRIDRTMTPRAFTVRFHGTHDSHAYCTMQPVGLDHEEVVVAPPTGFLHIIVLQPAFSARRDSVRVQ